MTFTQFLIVAVLSALAGGAFVKYSCNWLHAQPAGPVRDTLLRIMNGGPGPLPK